MALLVLLAAVPGQSYLRELSSIDAWDCVSLGMNYPTHYYSQIPASSRQPAVRLHPWLTESALTELIRG